MAERKKHEPMTLSAGEVSLICDFLRDRPDYEIEDTADSLRRCFPVFIPQSQRKQAEENFRRLGFFQ